MDKIKLKELLEGYNPQNVDNFINYCYKLTTEKDKDGKPKNYWSINISDEKFAEIFKKVDAEGLVFDGNHITLQSTGVTYDYVALKNKMLIAYPESEIDIQLVYEGDDINFWKTNGKIEYEHKINNPFGEQKDEDIIGAYVVIKNKRGEFLTTMNKLELEKHRKTAKTDFIWKSWYKEMCMKTIMKKATKMHFGDIFTKIEEMDNENYSLENPLELELNYKSEIDNIKTLDELTQYWQKNKGQGVDFDKYIYLRKQQILKENKSNENS